VIAALASIVACRRPDAEIWTVSAKASNWGKSRRFEPVLSHHSEHGFHFHTFVIVGTLALSCVRPETLNLI
jgi:hypothetical protein